MVFLLTAREGSEPLHLLFAIKPLAYGVLYLVRNDVRLGKRISLIVASRVGIVASVFSYSAHLLLRMRLRRFK